MNIHLRKLALIEELLQIKSEEIIIQLENLLKNNRQHSFQEEKEPFTLQQLEERINNSEEDFKNGKYKSTDDLITKY